jgi:hypothetical protein
LRQAQGTAAPGVEGHGQYGGNHIGFFHEFTSMDPGGKR